MKLIERDGFWIREEYADQDMVIVNDIYHNDAYRLELIAERVAKAKLIVDVGAHIGCFAKRVRRINPTATLFCVEAEPRNREALAANLRGLEPYYVIGKACTYDPRPLELWTAFTYHGCESTGGGVVAPIEYDLNPAQYMPVGTVEKITLEDIRRHAHYAPIDLLKLDCEGSEFSILANCDLSGVRFIVGEYHGRQQWDYLREWRMPHWDYGHMSESGDLGNFHLRNPR